ncbi:E3 ubiquitin-protein ligase RNF31-like [Rhinophrynus dorsalis]
MTNSDLLGLVADVECFLRKEISSRFPSTSCYNGEAPINTLVNRMAPRKDSVFQREQHTDGATASLEQRLDTKKGNKTPCNSEDAFKNLSLENIVKTYKLKMSSQGSPDLNKNTADNIDCQTEKHRMFQALCHVNRGCWSEEDLREAVNSCPDYTSALQYLSHECHICCNQYPFSKFVTMTHCCCSLCESCFINYFTTVIKEKSIIYVVCPLCKKPDLEKGGNTEDTVEFFNLLDTQIRHYLDKATHDLFQRKLRDRTLMQMPNFRWCCHCSFGLLHEAARLRMDCPSCQKSTCFNCKEPWEEQHERISCEEFRIWKLNNQPSYQEVKLEAYLTTNGIDCPSCKFRFDLSKGGCLHFSCTQCKHDFCGGCWRPFKLGSECDFSHDCHTKGLHAHHTRSCFYYLRDWDVERLHQLLEQSGIQYEVNTPGSVKGVCSLLQRWKAENTGHNENTLENNAGELDLKEYLVKIINANALDPVDMYTENEMKAELQRWKLTVPGVNGAESRESYQQRLKMKIKQEIPLQVDPN